MKISATYGIPTRPYPPDTIAHAQWDEAVALYKILQAAAAAA